MTVSAEAGQDKPKIGIAFSGGGAKGFAHIGVLKVFEEEGLQAEIVTGTSMGSIIGGLYAMGYSPAFLENMAMNVDWFDVFRETVDRKYLSMRQKMYRDRYLLAFPLYDGSVQLPSGLIKGQKIHRLFYELTWPVIEIDDFSDFPRDFSCVATDIATGEPYVIDSGSLADAMRASMAIPTAFAPFNMDGRKLVDGGLVRNLPSLDADALAFEQPEATPEVEPTVEPSTTNDPGNTSKEADVPAPEAAESTDLSRLLDELIVFVEQERGHEFTTRPVVTLLSGTAFTAEWDALIATDALESADEYANNTDIYRAMGIIDDSATLEEIWKRFGDAGVLGYYDPDGGDIVLRAGDITAFTETVFKRPATCEQLHSS